MVFVYTQKTVSNGRCARPILCIWIKGLIVKHSSAIHWWKPYKSKKISRGMRLIIPTSFHNFQPKSIKDWTKKKYFRTSDWNLIDIVVFTGAYSSCEFFLSLFIRNFILSVLLYSNYSQLLRMSFCLNINIVYHWFRFDATVDTPIFLSSINSKFCLFVLRIFIFCFSI